MDLFNLTGKNAVVVGAGGLGQAIAEGVIMAGAKVTLIDLVEDALKRAQGELKSTTGQDVKYVTCDATNEDAVAASVEKIVADVGKVDILICAQGINRKHPAEDFPMDDFRKMLEINVTSVMLCCKHFAKHMIKNGYGKIVILASVRCKIATLAAGNAGYCTTKGAIGMLTQQLASEFGPHGITVNAIAPAVTETPMMTAVIEQRGGDAYRKAFGDSLPMRRMPVPADMQGTAIFLSAPASDFMTGHVLFPDGGQTAVG